MTGVKLLNVLGRGEKLQVNPIHISFYITSTVFRIID